MQDDPRITVDNTVEGVSKLEIKATLAEDTGTYVCEGNNPAGRFEEKTDLTIQCKLI